MGAEFSGVKFLRFSGVGASIRVFDAFSEASGASSLEMAAERLKGDATEGFAFGVSGSRSGDLKGLWRALFSRRRLIACGVSIAADTGCKCL